MGVPDAGQCDFTVYMRQSAWDAGQSYPGCIITTGYQSVDLDCGSHCEVGEVQCVDVTQRNFCLECQTPYGTSTMGCSWNP